MPRPERCICVLPPALRDEKEAKKLVKPVVKELKSWFGAAPCIPTEEDVTLEKAVVDLLWPTS